MKDPVTGQNKTVCFGNFSRCYNNMFALAVHEIQSSTAEREVHLHTPWQPANVRIHGTMYRKVWNSDARTGLRYLIVDPQERCIKGQSLGGDKKVLAQLERILLPGNTHMQIL